jgi:hypothetical protein
VLPCQSGQAGYGQPSVTDRYIRANRDETYCREA